MSDFVLGQNLKKEDSKWRGFEMNSKASSSEENRNHGHTDETKITVRDLNFYYGKHKALENISIDIKTKKVTALIGPSGCGKSTFLRLFNRMNDLIPMSRIEGKIRIDGKDIYGRDTDVVELRRKVGMVFQKSTPFVKSIYDNVAYGLRILGIKDKTKLDQRVETSLRHAAL